MKKLILFAIIILVGFSLSAQQKYALVIGNGAYTNLGRLNNPVNDANDMADVLTSLGFTVEKILNGSLDEMESAIMRLKNRLSVSKNSYGFFFYAGHGVQSNGVNYLIPVGVNIPGENYLRERAVSMQAMLSELNDAKNALNVVILDACRDNPFGWARSGTRGLSQVGNQPADSIIVYATTAGSVASDGTGRNGLFTGYLLKNLKISGLEVNEIFRLTGADVSAASNKQQVPAVYNQFFGVAFLNTNSASAPQPVPAPAQTSAPPAVNFNSTNISANMVLVQGGTFTMGSPASEWERMEYEGPQHQVTVSSFYINKYEITKREYRELMGKTTFRSDYYNTDDNIPATCSWFDAIEFCNKLSQKEKLTPVYRSSGDMIICDWEANGYRLPTEAEWEYAAKGGNKDSIIYKYSGSNRYEAVARYSSNKDASLSPMPVGLLIPNILGLYDMSGNVSEWCWDWYGKYSGTAQQNPTGPNTPNTREDRINRGGSFRNTSRGIRSSRRGFDDPYYDYDSIGIRVVRSAPAGR